MVILHTSDWHLGAWLNDKDNSRLPEQRDFVDEVCGICETNGVELVLVAGDVFDIPHPSAAAEALYFEAMERLSDGGRRPVVVVAGNHDDPNRLTAANPILVKCGVIVLGTPNSTVDEFCNEYFEVRGLCKCCFELKLFGTGETCIVAAMPYPSEKRLNERLTGDSDFDEKNLQNSYSMKIGSLFSDMAAFYRKDTVNLAVGHFYLLGGSMSTGSERDVSLGGGFAVSLDALPENADYVALGHLHRPQIIGGSKAYYSGSPIAYSLSEKDYSKCVYVADVKNGTADVKKVLLNRRKPLEEWTFNSSDEAVEFCEKNRNREFFAYIKIRTPRPLYAQEIKAIRSAKQDIVTIDAILTGGKDVETTQYFEEKTVLEEFSDFYLKEQGVKPPDEILRLIDELLQEEDDE